MGITIRDVAEAAGVSTATVSRALRGLPHVDEATRDRVQRVAQELDYVVSPSASRLASGRTGCIAVITPYISRWFFATVLSGVESVLQASDMDLLLFSVGDPMDEHRVVPERRLRRRVDGVIVVSLPVDHPESSGLLDLGLPVSLIGVRSPGVPSVAIDDVLAARKATQHLVELGHRRIAVIGGRTGASVFTPEHDRGRGYQDVLAEAGIPADPRLRVPGGFTVPGGDRAMTRLLDLDDPPTAVFAMSDEMAFGALNAMRRRGVRPGVDLAMVGIDGHELSGLLDLTTVVQPVYRMGSMAAEALLEQLAGHDDPVALRPTLAPTSLVVRGSTRPRATVDG